MDFEYGCATVNKFAFLDENEVDDPSDLLAQVAIAKEAAAASKVSSVKTKIDPKTGKKVDAKTGKPVVVGKDAAKKPLQPTAIVDNSAAVKKTTDTDRKDLGEF